jgi:putative membrane protein
VVSVRATVLIDPAARQRLEATIGEQERTTSGELVLVVAGACDEYGSAGWRLGVLFAALAFTGLAAFAPPPYEWIYLIAQAIALLAGHALARIDTIRRWLLDEALVETRVAERARRAFAEQGLTRTAGGTGVLLFVALLERRVVVLADEGIHRVLDPDERWSDVVELAVAGLRSGRAVDGLDAALRRCGAILARHAPPRGHNPDELPNRVVLQD